jgi:hypothetical protein
MAFVGYLLGRVQAETNGASFTARLTPNAVSRPPAERLARTAAMGSCRTFGGARPSSSIGKPSAPHRGAPLSSEVGTRTG